MSATKAIYALVGSDPFLQLEGLRDILKDLGPVQRRDFDGDSAVLHEVLDEVRSYSMFGPSKLVVIRDADDFLSNYREKLEDFVTEVGERKGSIAGVLVLRLSSLPASQRIYKAISKVGEVRVCEPPTQGAVPAWIIARARGVHHAEIDRAAASALAELIGNDLGRLDTELGKLAIQSSDGTKTPTITVSDVSKLVTFQRDQEVKEITALLARGQTGNAIRRWRQLTATDSSAEYKGVTWLCIWLERCRTCLDLLDAGTPVGQMGRALWINDPTELKEFVATAAKLGRSGLADRLGELAELDHRVKSGLVDAAEGIERYMAMALAGK